MVSKKLGITVLLCFSCVSKQTYALDLMQAWQAALTNDKEYAVAQANLGLVEPRQEQAQALWRPNVSASAMAGLGYQRTNTEGAQFSTPAFGSSTDVNFNTSINGGFANRLALTAVQPLYDLTRRAEQAQLSHSADLADLKWQAGKQALMLKVAQQHFAVALAQKSLAVIGQQKQQITKVAQEMHDRFNLGSVPITDTHEADARLAAVEAEYISAELNLQNAKNLLADTTSLPIAEIKVQPISSNIAPTALKPLETYIVQSSTGNVQVRISEVQAEIAKQEIKKYTQASAMKIDGIAQASRDEIDGHGRYGNALSQQNNAVVGIQLSMPLYTGGYRNAKLVEAEQLLFQAQAQAQLSQEQAAQQIRQIWLTLNSGKSKLNALEQSLKAGKLRLDATQLGRQVGDRTTLDVLSAENAVANAQLNLIQTQVELIMANLHLSALAGQLSEQDLNAVNP